MGGGGEPLIPTEAPGLRRELDVEVKKREGELEKLEREDRKRVIEKFTRDVGKSALEKAVVMGLSAAIPQAAPIIIAGYRTYKALETAKRIYERYNEIEGSKRERIIKAVTGTLGGEAVAKTITEAEKQAVKGQVEKFSRDVVSEMVKSGVVSSVGGTLGFTPDERDMFRAGVIAAVSGLIYGSLEGANQSIVNMMVDGLL